MGNNLLITRHKLTRVTPLLFKERFLSALSIERNPFPAKNQTLRSYRVYILPTK